MVNHMIFWREYHLRAMKGDKPKDAERERRNWESPADPTDEEWEATKARFENTQQRAREAMADAGSPLDRLKYFLPHDSYHVGQIMYLRAMQGMKAIE